MLSYGRHLADLPFSTTRPPPVTVPVPLEQAQYYRRIGNAPRHIKTSKAGSGVSQTSTKSFGSWPEALRMIAITIALASLDYTARGVWLLWREFSARFAMPACRYASHLK